MALQKFPGFIDVHVHLRDPGATQKEDFITGSKAAIAGGFTFICDMPNNPSMPTISIDRLKEKVALAGAKAICDLGFHYGTDGKNLETFKEAASHPNVFGLKVYCNDTTGDLLVNDEKVLDRIFTSWRSDKPILVHAEGAMLDICLELANRYERRLHVCHVSETSGVEKIRRAKEQHKPVTAGATPHHLFLKKQDVDKLGAYAVMKPPLGNESTIEALWEGIRGGVIDIIESDHAPHTKEEKASGAQFFGVPGLETTIGLLVHAVVEKKLTLGKVTTLLYDNPTKIFGIPNQPNTYIELDPTKSYIVGADGYQTKCGWSPFDGWQLHGKVEHLVLRGKSLVEGGRMV